jgi:O-antigen/teichoic acid export membrane protein
MFPRQAGAVRRIMGAKAHQHMMAPALKKYLPAKVVLTAILIAIALGLLFEGVMIGPEYQRYKPPYLILAATVLFAVFFAWLWWQEREEA